jgi:hypothetical protein
LKLCERQSKKNKHVRTNSLFYFEIISILMDNNFWGKIESFGIALSIHSKQLLVRLSSHQINTMQYFDKPLKNCNLLGGIKSLVQTPSRIFQIKETFFHIYFTVNLSYI